MSKIWGALIKVQVLFPFPTWCDCSRSLSHRGFSHSPIICCWTLSPRPLSTGVITINLNSEFFSFSVSPCRPHRWRHTSRHTSPPPSHHHQLIFSKGGRGGKNKLSTFLQGLAKSFLKTIIGSTIFAGNSLLQNFRTCVIWYYDSIAYKIWGFIETHFCNNTLVEESHQSRGIWCSLPHWCWDWQRHKERQTSMLEFRV